MLGKIPVRKYLISSILPFQLFDHDKISEDSKPPRSYYEQIQENETGWDRLHTMFSIDEFGNMSPELHSSFQATFLGLFIGACYGGFVRSRIAYLDFMERNEATTFKSHLDAKKQLQDRVTVGFAKGAFQWGWRLGLFSGSYVLISTSISVYRGKSSMVEYIVAGAVTGSCYKMNMGARGMLVGGLLGSLLGTFAGGVSLALLKATGMTMEEVRFWQYRWKDSRLKQTHKLFKDYKAADDPPLLTHHNEKFKTSEGLLESLDSSSVVTDAAQK
ncbi:RPII140-upstream gene protein [Anabrus simplex]|uniref:RPII140-upstream gene protein n=1 Tax=Anabrus simplex TaxID=316456 RepID=UPI0035A28E65